MKNIHNNIQNIKNKIQHLLEHNNNLFKKIKIIAASKNQSIQIIETARSYGIYEFGENYVQEAISKIKKIKKQNNIIWHFIGKIQSNKIKLIAQYFDWCQTIDREKIAILLNKYRTNKKIPINVLIQINISQENTKNGICTKNYLKLAKTISKLPYLKFRGIMAMPKKQNKIIKCDHYKQIYDIFHDLKNKYTSVDTLSLGTSFDIEQAILHNSNMLRIGKKIFND